MLQDGNERMVVRVEGPRNNNYGAEAFRWETVWWAGAVGLPALAVGAADTPSTDVAAVHP